MRPTTSSLAVVAAIICAQHVARAQYTTSATCPTSFDWALNQQKQSPCLVAAYVQGACSATGRWDVPAMPSLQVFYNPPLDDCGCSIANYNLLSACAACQGAQAPRFPYWTLNCSNASLLDITTYYPTTKWPIADGVQIPLWAQEDARLWTNMQFNSTEAQEIATTGKLIGSPLGSPSSTTNPSSSLSSTMSTSTAPTSAPQNDSHTDIGPIVGGVVGGVLGLLLIAVLIWWIVRRRRPSFEDGSPSLSAVPFTFSSPKGPTPALVKMAVPVAQRPAHQSYPSYMSSTPSTPHGTGNMENRDGSPAIIVQHAPGALDHPGAFTSHPYATADVGLTFSPPSMSSSGSVGRPSDAPPRIGSSSSRSMIARFVFPRRRNDRHSNAPSTLSQGSSGMSQIGILQSPPTNVGYLPQPPGLSPIPGPATLEPTPYLLPPQSQGAASSSGDGTSHSQVTTKPRINPPGYTPPEAAIPSALPQPNPAVQAHMFNTDLNRLIAATPAPMSPETPNPPSYLASEAESREERLRRTGSVATAGTLASSSNVLPTPSTPERRGDLLPPVPERDASPDDEPDYPQEKV